MRSPDGVQRGSLFNGDGDPATPRTVAPGTFAFSQDAGGRAPALDYSVTWWDPRALSLGATSSFGQAVNMTIGLPFLRTSVDHGTAWDIAGTGAADPSSLVEALVLAARLAPRARA